MPCASLRSCSAAGCLLRWITWVRTCVRLRRLPLPGMRILVRSERPIRYDATVSMKVTALGLDISEEACRANTESLVRLACDTGTRVELDMEDTSYTDRNLKIVHEMHERHSGGVRAVIQAYLYRSESDIHASVRSGSAGPVVQRRLQRACGGRVSRKADVDKNYLKLMRLLFDRGTYPAIATHDDPMVEATLDYVRERKVRSDAFEFQMLYGVRRDLQQRLAREGYRVRLYVPYGGAWYPYFMRRLAERPANVLFIAKNLFAG